MDSVQLDTKWFVQNIRGLIDIRPVEDYDTKQHKTDRNGLPKWRLQLLWGTPEMRKPLVIEVNYASDEVTRIEPGSPIPEFHGLAGRHWSNQNEYGFSSGISLSAERIEFPTSTSKQRPAAAEAAA